jgi:hypothetical protein
MLENYSNIWKPMNRLKVSIFLLTTNLSWWLMKKKVHEPFQRFLDFFN